jgi:hypothetical protein
MKVIDNQKQCAGPGCKKDALPGSPYCSKNCGARFRYHARYKQVRSAQRTEAEEEYLKLDEGHEHVFPSYSPTRCLICRRQENRRAFVKEDLPAHRLNEIAPPAGAYTWN